MIGKQHAGGVAQMPAAIERRSRSIVCGAGEASIAGGHRVSVSTATYRLRLNSAGSKQMRRFWEICECNINGQVRRIIARTPAILGEGDRQDIALAEAKSEASRMLKAFKA